MSKHQDKKYIDTRRIIWSILLYMLIAILLWSLLFHLAEGRGYFDSLYFTVITFSTIGYWDIVPVTHLGKIIAMVYALLWVPLFVGITSVVMELRFKKFVFHHFEHTTKQLHKSDLEIKKELQAEELKNASQAKEIKKIEKIIEAKKESMISKLMKKIKK